MKRDLAQRQERIRYLLHQIHRYQAMGDERLEVEGSNGRWYVRYASVEGYLGRVSPKLENLWEVIAFLEGVCYMAGRTHLK